MESSERSPLLRPTRKNHRRGSDGAHASGDNEHTGEEDGVQLGVEDIAVEGMVLVLLRELVGRGYAVPRGLVEPHSDLLPEEAEAEARVFRAVLAVPRHRAVLDEFMPIRESLQNGGPLSPRPFLPETPISSSSRPSPLSSQILDSTVVSSPSALFLSTLLSLLISLHAEAPVVVQETDRGVDGELRMFKARRDLGERLYAVVGGLLDSYLISGDGGAEDGEDALVTLLFHDFPLDYDSMDRTTCALDLLLNLSSYPLVEAEALVSHPVVLASSEYVWRNGLLPAPHRGTTTAISWRDAVVNLDRFSAPRILHSQTYILSTVHSAVTVYILMFSRFGHFDALNPLAPAKGIHVIASLVWWLWVAGSLGWAGEVGRAWASRFYAPLPQSAALTLNSLPQHHRGPHPSLPLSPSTLLPLIHHSLVLIAVALRFSLLFIPKPSPPFILATSLSVLAWSIPFLAASRILPQNSPAFGAPTHQRWEKIRDGRKRRDVGYRPPPNSIPTSHRALRSLEAHLGGLIQFGSFFAVWGILLLWSLSGELDYPGPSLFFLPVTAMEMWTTSDLSAATSGKKASPLEARTTLAFTLILGVVLAYFSGGRPSVSAKVSTPSSSGDRRGLGDLDGWERYGREVAFRSRRERLAVNRYYTFLPPAAHPSPDSVPSAFSTPPLPSPLNLAIPALLLASFISREMGSEAYARSIQERGRLWVWRAGISPLAIWAVLAKSVRRFRGRD